MGYLINVPLKGLIARIKQGFYSDGQGWAGYFVRMYDGERMCTISQAGVDKYGCHVRLPA